mgnify:CR=1 FL=1
MLQMFTGGLCAYNITQYHVLLQITPTIKFSHDRLSCGWKCHFLLIDMQKIHKVVFTRNLKFTEDLNQDTGSRTGTISLYPGFIYFSTIVMLYIAWFTKTSACSKFLSGFILQPARKFHKIFKITTKYLIMIALSLNYYQKSNMTKRAC